MTGITRFTQAQADGLGRRQFEEYLTGCIAGGEGPVDVEQLTERETDILKLISHGSTSKEIGQKLNISYYTVTTHIKNIYTKLQVNSRTEAIHEANRQGLLKS